MVSHKGDVTTYRHRTLIIQHLGNSLRMEQWWAWYIKTLTPYSVCRKICGKNNTKSGIQRIASPSWQCTCTLCVVCALFLAKNWTTVLLHTPHSADLVLCYYVLFPELKMALNRRMLNDITMSHEKSCDMLAEFQTMHLMKCSEWWSDHWTHSVRYKWPFEGHKIN